MKTTPLSIVLLTIVAGGIFLASCRKIKMGKCCNEDAPCFYENDSSYFALPNIVIQNDGGMNNGLVVMARGVQSYHLSVHKTNLLKTKVFESTDIATRWYGTYKGKYVSEGAYKYSVEITLQSGQQYAYEGTVCLVRKEFRSENCRNCKYASQFNGKEFDTSIPGGFLCY